MRLELVEGLESLLLPVEGSERSNLMDPKLELGSGRICSPFFMFPLSTSDPDHVLSSFGCLHDEIEGSTDGLDDNSTNALEGPFHETLDALSSSTLHRLLDDAAHS